MWKLINRSCNFFLLLLLSFSCVTAKKAMQPGTLTVEARKWNKVDGKVSYSDWSVFRATTMDQLPGFKPETETIFNKYGSDPSRSDAVTGFYHTRKTGGRWWIIDPMGNACLQAGVNGVRPGTSSRNDQALAERFGDEQSWVRRTHDDLILMGFSGAACWSDVPLIRSSNAQADHPVSYTVILNFYQGYQKNRSQKHKDDLSFAVFDREFEVYVDRQSQTLTESRNDPNLLGYFSDNELAFSTKILDECLAAADTADPNRKAAAEWIRQRNLNAGSLRDSDREEFLGVVAERYYQVVSGAIRKYDPNHLYLGSRLHGKVKHLETVVRAAGRYCDIISINYYGHWEPLAKHFEAWAKWAEKPVIITEFYVKGDDSGLANMTGAGWRVRTQEDRGHFYENFCIQLLRMKNCVGWHWFRYMDNDPTDTTADQSNQNSNKGIVDNYYRYYEPLTRHMTSLNRNRYRLVTYFDRNE